MLALSTYVAGVSRIPHHRFNSPRELFSRNGVGKPLPDRLRTNRQRHTTRNLANVLESGIQRLRRIVHRGRELSQRAGCRNEHLVLHTTRPASDDSKADARKHKCIIALADLYQAFLKHHPREWAACCDKSAAVGP